MLRRVDVDRHGRSRFVDRRTCRGRSAARADAAEKTRLPMTDNTFDRVLVIDVGGSFVKAFATGASERRRFESGPTLTPRRLVDGVHELARGWQWDAVSIGVPAPVRNGVVQNDPINLGAGWCGFDFETAFGRPVRVVNDAEMQALGSYEGGRMLFLGLGTGLGTALIDDGHLVGIEAARLPFRDGEIEDAVGERGLTKLGIERWTATVFEIVGLLRTVFVADYVVLGGGNVNRLAALPPHTRRGDNDNAFTGGFRLWQAGAGSSGARR